MKPENNTCHFISQIGFVVSPIGRFEGRQEEDLTNRHSTAPESKWLRILLDAYLYEVPNTQISRSVQFPSVQRIEFSHLGSEDCLNDWTLYAEERDSFETTRIRNWCWWKMCKERVKKLRICTQMNLRIPKMKRAFIWILRIYSKSHRLEISG